LPLIDETAKKVHDLSPFEAQTGPAVRFDKNVMENHEQLILDAELRTIYQSISNNIHKRHTKESQTDD